MLMASLVTHQPSMKLNNRKLQPLSKNDMSSQPINSTLHNSTFTAPSPSKLPYSASPFDSSMALTIVVLLTALFFMGFVSIYLRRFSNTNPSSNISSGRTNTTSYRLPPKGLDPQVIKSLPVYDYYHGNAKYYQIECAVCLGEFEDKESVKMIPYCGHVFHLECIDKWLHMHVTCPVCRGTQFFEVVVGNVSGGAGGALVVRARSTIENTGRCDV